MSPGNEYKSMQSSLKSWKQDCVCFAHVCVFVESGKTLLSFVFVMITHGGITLQATRWSLSVREIIKFVFPLHHLSTM